MKNLISLVLFVLIIGACNSGGKQQNNADTSASDTTAMVAHVRDGVFIHITEGYNDPHRVLMPLKMATMMAGDKDVLVYMDIHAVELLVKGAKDMQYADFESAQAYIKKLLDKNVGIYACPTCLKIAGFKESDLLAGVQLAQKDKFFNFTKGRIVNLDY
ncbi:MAG TPA: DsrE family protein [Bacteroidales bacterium]|nr:DsrE family protein [Bacteroidales bacterium]